MGEGRKKGKEKERGKRKEKRKKYFIHLDQNKSKIVQMPTKIIFICTKNPCNNLIILRTLHSTSLLYN